MSSSVSVLPSLAALALVIALIPAALWLLRRVQGLRPARDGVLELAAGLAVGPRERIAVVNVGGRALVVGITAQSITHLATLDAPVAPQAAGGTPAALAPFAQLLAARLGRDRGPGAPGAPG